MSDAHSTTATSDRRDAVLQAALAAFARYGYRKTSMEQIASAAHISRPGLYFLFDSKEELFRAAVVRALDDDLGNVERILGGSERPIRARLHDAFDRWAGRYIGTMSRDVTALVDDHPELLGEIVADRPQRFANMVISAISATGTSEETSAALAHTLISTSIGIKHQVDDRAAYGEKLAIAIDLLLR